MTKIIINSDDCGYSKEVDEHIGMAIRLGKVTSSTIMANMSDFEGAIKLSEEFGQDISFGVHLNLTEGEPLLESSVLLKEGFYIINEDKIVFNGNQFRYRPLSSAARNAVIAELDAQVKKLIASGVSISHIDSHHHIHTSPFILPLVLQVAKENGIHRIRRAGDNFMHGSKLYRILWQTELRCLDKTIKTTDHFWGFDEFLSVLKKKKKPYCPESSIELMTHPGGKYHPEEEHSLLSFQFATNCFSFLNYNQL